MKALKIAIVHSFTPPPQGAELVAFCSGRSYIAHYDTPKMLAAAVRYAKEYEVYLVTDCFVSDDHLCMCMLDPNGEPVLGQQAIYQNLSYRGLFKRSSELQIAETPFGKVCLLVDVDINYPQVLRLACEKGAQLVIASSYIQLFDFYEDRINYSALNAAASNGVYVALVTNTGSCIAAPDGNYIAPFTDCLPIGGDICPGEIAHDPKTFAFSRSLIGTHRDVLCEGVAVVI